MACTLLRIVQAAVSLRRRFECAIHSSFESESGVEEQRGRDQAEEEHSDQPSARPRAEDLTTSEHLSRTFRLTFEEEDVELDAVGDAEALDTMTFLPAESQEGADEGAAYTDAPTSTSIDILEESRFSSPGTPEDGTPALPTHALVSNPFGDSPPPPEALPSPVFPHVAQAPSLDMPDSPSCPLPVLPLPPVPVLPLEPPRVQVHEVSGSERSSSDSESSSDSRCSVKSVRLRDAVSPSSGCKPPKLIRSDAMVSSAEREASGSLRWVLMLEEAGPATLKEEERQSVEGEQEKEEVTEEQEEGRGDSDSDGTELLAYSEWLLKGKQSLELESSSGEDAEDRTMSEDDDEEEEEREENDDVEVDYDDYDFEDEDSDEDEEYLADEGEGGVAEASFEDSFVDDGFVSLEMDDYDEDVIIEENEEDLERERMEEEMMLEIRRNLQRR